MSLQNSNYHKHTQAWKQTQQAFDRHTTQLVVTGLFWQLTPSICGLWIPLLFRLNNFG